MIDRDDALDTILSAAPPSPSEAEARAETLRVRNERVEQNRRLVYSVARRYRRSRVPLEDIEQLGNVGLIRAAEEFDPGGGGAFSTVATWRIRSAILDGLARGAGTIYVPPSARKLRRAFRGREREMEAAEGRPVGFAEVADAMGLAPRHREVVRAALATERTGGSDVVEMDLVGAEGPEAREDHPRLRRALRHLAPGHRRIVELRYGFDGGGARTQAEVAAIAGVSASRIGHVEGAALAKLRGLLSNQGAATA